MNSIEEVEELISKVDTDGSGEIEFDEFINIFFLQRNEDSHTASKSTKLADFFLKLISGHSSTSGLPFSNQVLREQRMQMIQTMIQKRDEIGD